MIYSRAEYERFIGALWLNTKLKGGKPKTYEAYVKKWEESDPANTYSPSLASPADVDEFLANHKAEKEGKPGHEYKAKDTVIWDGMVPTGTGSAEKKSDPCAVRIRDVLSASSVFDYEIKTHDDIAWCVYAHQLTPIPGEPDDKIEQAHKVADVMDKQLDAILEATEPKPVRVGDKIQLTKPIINIIL